MHAMLEGFSSALQKQCKISCLPIWRESGNFSHAEKAERDEPKVWRSVSFCLSSS